MTSIALHPTPRWQTVAKEQVRAVGVALRNEGILFLIALGVVALLAILGAIKSASQMHGQPDFTYGPPATIPITLIAFVLPFSVWKSEDPSRRSYHWAMPVARVPHTLMKTVAGWLWLMAAVVIYLLYIIVLGSVVAYIVGTSTNDAAVPAWQWIVPFTSATVAYLLGSTIVIASDHPWRWIVGAFVAFMAVFILLHELGWENTADAWEGIVNGYHGLQTAGFGDVYVRHAGASAARWFSATAIWAALGIAGVAGALFRRGDE